MNTEPPPLRMEEENRTGGWRLPLLIAAVVGLAVLGGILWLGPPAPERVGPPIPAELPPLTAENEAYLEQIEISGLELSRWQNFLGQSVVYLDANLANHGPKSILALDWTLEFRDPYGQVVLRETVRVVGERLSPLGAPPSPVAAGEMRNFRAAFEHLPADWNQGLPEHSISGLLLE